MDVHQSISCAHIVCTKGLSKEQLERPQEPVSTTAHAQPSPSIFSHHVYLRAASVGGLLEKSTTISLLHYMNPCDPMSQSPDSTPLGCCLLIPLRESWPSGRSESVLVPYAGWPGWALQGMGVTLGLREGASTRPWGSLSPKRAELLPPSEGCDGQMSERLLRAGRQSTLGRGFCFIQNTHQGNNSPLTVGTLPLVWLLLEKSKNKMVYIQTYPLAPRDQTPTSSISYAGRHSHHGGNPLNCH